MGITVEIILLCVLLALAAVTAASEIAVIAANRFKLRKLASGGSRPAKLVLGMIKVPERFFGTILVSNNIVGALIAVLITSVVIKSMGGSSRLSIVVSTAIASFLIIVSEVTAKTLATRYAEKTSLTFAYLIRALIVALAPVVKVLEYITRSIVIFLGGKTDVKPSLLTEEEIRAFIKVGEEEGVLQKDKYAMLTKVFDFSDTLVSQVMTPKRSVTAINADSSFDEIIETVMESGYSRIPVYKGNDDNIIGIINMKDLLMLSSNRDLVVLQDIIYPATCVSSAKKVTELLKEFQKGHTHLAIVKEPSGSYAGIVTLEDLLEELVGEIEDEYDVRVTNYKNRNLS